MPRFSVETKELLTAVTRDKAFECAYALLREAGWRQFTMEKLSKRMGVSKGTLYNYFKDKEEVILFIRDSISRQIAEKMQQEADQEPDTRKLLRSIVIHALTEMKEFRFLQLAVSEVMMRRQSFSLKGESDENETLSLPDGSMDHVHRVFVEILERGIADGSVRQGNPRIMAAVLQSALFGVDMAGKFYSCVSMESQEVQEQIASILLNGICKEEK